MPSASPAPAPAPAANWSYPTDMRSGPGRIAEAPQAAASLGISRPLVVTDSGLRDQPFIARVVDDLNAAGLPVALFADVRGNPDGAAVEAAVAAFHAHGADGVIAVGGGSGLDVGKAAAFMAGQTRPIWDYEDVGDWWTRADADAIAPVVAVPTTAGTGSEVGRASVIVNADTHEKKIIFHPRMMPGVVIADPELTTGLPAPMTAATGMDALTHCFEAFCAPGFHPMAEGIALQGMRLIKTALPRAFHDGNDIEARAHMLAAASMGATAFQKGLGGVHAISHAVGAAYDTHHGLTNAIVLPYIMRVNEQAIAPAMEVLARVLDLPQGKNQNQNGARNSFAAVLDWILALRGELGIPHSLGEIGVPDDDAAAVGEAASRDPSAGGNPIKLSPQTYAETFVKAVRGED